MTDKQEVIKKIIESVKLRSMLVEKINTQKSLKEKIDQARKLYVKK